ncbi:PH domain-containing protein [Microbacterium sp. cx-59]|uniref:PH domain-containing protein n=1 Tax=Microbacterium sp. cx-59 TaxID=2891207 RepID=UPI001E355024|nr:PH domain-containing protein [Microbacterium sp. cx-59]MCC4906848.1 PH domain-containing protein [Microbacterium sp. cx-59]
MFRGTSGTIGLIVSGVIAFVLLGDALLRAGIGETLLLAPWILLVLWLVYVTLYASHVTITREGAVVQNYLRRTTVPWGRVADIRMRWQVVFVLTDGSEVKAYGGPVAGRPARVGPRSGAGEGRRVPPALRELGIIQDAWESERAESRPDAPIARQWDIPALVALLVIVVGAVSAVVGTI